MRSPIKNNVKACNISQRCEYFADSPVIKKLALLFFILQIID